METIVKAVVRVAADLATSPGRRRIEDILAWAAGLPPGRLEILGIGGALAFDLALVVYLWYRVRRSRKRLAPQPPQGHGGTATPHSGEQTRAR